MLEHGIYQTRLEVDSADCSDSRLTDLKFWNKFVPQDHDYITHDRQLRLIVCASKMVFTYDIPSFEVTDTQRSDKEIKPFTEIVVVNEDSFFVVKADSNVWYMRSSRTDKSQTDDQDPEYDVM